MTGDRKPVPFATAPFNERGAGVLARRPLPRVHVERVGPPRDLRSQSFPGPGGKWQISTAGGADPHWRADGKELFYRGADQKLMAVEMSGGRHASRPASRRRSSSGAFHVGNARNKYLPAADGQRFLFVAPLGRESMTPTTVVLNWFAALGK